MFLGPLLASHSLNFFPCFFLECHSQLLSLADTVFLGLILNITNSICSQDDWYTGTWVRIQPHTDKPWPFRLRRNLFNASLGSSLVLGSNSKWLKTIWPQLPFFLLPSTVSLLFALSSKHTEHLTELQAWPTYLSPGTLPSLLSPFSRVNITYSNVLKMQHLVSFALLAT